MTRSNDPSTVPLFPGLDSPAAGAAPVPASTGANEVARAMALLWAFRPRTAICSLLPLLGSKRSDGRPFTQDDVRRALAELRERGWLETIPNRDGYFRLRDDVRGRVYREVLDETPVATLREALRRLDRYSPDPGDYHWPLYDVAATVAHVRLELLSGASAKEIGRLRDLVQHTHDWTGVLWSAVFPSFDPALFDRIAPEWRWALAFSAVTEMCIAWRADMLPVCEWAIGKLDTDRAHMPESLLQALAELLMHRGEPARAQDALGTLKSGAADALRACLLVQAARWSEAQLAFEAAFKRRQVEVGARKRIFPASMAWLYPVALLAQQTPKHLDLARKFCLGEAGKRNPDPYWGWGRWAHAIGARLGDAALDRKAFELRPRSAHVGMDALWELLLAAWLGRDALGLNHAKRASRDPVSESAGALRDLLGQCRLGWLVTQVDAAEAVLRGDQPAPGFFVSGPREQWRDVLAALQALGAGQPENVPRAEASRIVWAIRVGKRGSVDAIEPLEQKRGPRGWNKPRPLALAKIAGSERLPPWDAKVARAIRQDRAYSRRWEIDRAAAVVALIAHPAVVLADAPEQLVDVVEGTPEVEVVKDGDRYLLRVTPSVHADEEPEERYWRDATAEREAEALRMITLVQDTPQRLRVIRLTAAQRRAAQLVSGRFTVPASAHDELQQALRSLAGHFQVHADHAQAAREIAAESRLRAELSPIGERLLLRLVVAPLGAEGPRVAPGIGRARLMAAIGGETVGTRRDLAVERASLEAVLDALPMLDEPEDPSAGFEWLIDDPEHALAAVEALPNLAAVAAVDWPKGKPVRVLNVDTRQLAVVVKRDGDWFRLHGRAVVDENIVLDFQTLMAAARSRSRFMPIGDGVYAALTHSLKARLADLAAVAETDRDAARVPRLAAAWLDEVLEDAQVESDGEFRAAIDRLHRAQDETASVPKALQAELRSYQEDGYRWAMRLASAGLGGCLADDMGLGKTLQGLAVLLARGAEGAALVIAPTSVCGNWLAEARRFAPTLNVTIYGDGERDGLVTKAGPMDVVIVSYSLLQQAQERFAARSWHTVIADEAQAIKNAAAKRSLAVFELDGRFSPRAFGHANRESAGRAVVDHALRQSGIARHAGAFCRALRDTDRARSRS